MALGPLAVDMYLPALPTLAAEFAVNPARVLSLMMLVMGAAPILAPLGGGWLLVHGSWHWILGFLGAFAALCFALVAGLLEESHPVHRRSASLLRSLAGALPLFRDRRFLAPTI